MKKLLGLLLLLASCIYPFDIPGELTEKLLVVDGYISTRAGDSEIRLSYTNEFNTRAADWIGGAEVKVIENGTLDHLFREKTIGLYTPDDTSFRADSQSVYKLHLVVQGKAYESGDVKVRKAAGIDTVKFRASDKYSSGQNLSYRALDFLITSLEDPDASEYYRYSADETWLVMAKNSTDKKIYTHFILDKWGKIIDVSWNIDYSEPTTYCWASSRSSGVSIASSDGLIRNQLVDVPVYGVTLKSPKLLYKYSLLLKQYSIPEEAYHFLYMLNKFSVNDFTLYETQPGYVEGNMCCLSDETEKVVGVFYAADVVEKRIFVRIFDLIYTDQLIVFGYDFSCPTQFVSIPNAPNSDKSTPLTYMRDSLMYYRNYVVSDLFTYQDSTTAVLTFEHCSDCRLMGSNLKPDYWGNIFY
jgi:hypothetical protein